MGLGWLAGWLAGLGYKVPYAACRKIPCPSAAAQRAVGPQPTKPSGSLPRTGFFREKPAYRTMRPHFLGVTYSNYLGGGERVKFFTKLPYP